MPAGSLRCASVAASTPFEAVIDMGHDPSDQALMHSDLAAPVLPLIPLLAARSFMFRNIIKSGWECLHCQSQRQGANCLGTCQGKI
jgi:hypothetical protein